MQRFGAILIFYKPYFLWSFGINILMMIFNDDLFPAIITKLLLTIFLWYVITETYARRKLIFYKNLGISTLKLFTYLFFIDIFITIIFHLLIKEYI